MLTYCTRRDVWFGGAGGRFAGHPGEGFLGGSWDNYCKLISGGRAPSREQSRYLSLALF